MTRALLCLALWLLGAQAAAAGGVKSYFESSANQKPRGNAGVSVTGDRLKLDAGVAMRGTNRSTQIVPQVRSAFTISDRLGVETLVRMSEWNSRTELPGAKVDTKVHFRSPAPFLDELEGRVWRSPDGQSGRILKFGFYQTLSQANVLTPLTMSNRAVLETAVGATPLAASTATASPRAQNRRVGLETELGGLTTRFVPGKAALKIKIDRIEGARAQTAGSVAYNHSWNVGTAARVGFNVNMRSASYAPPVGEPTLGLTWKWEL